MQFLKNYKCSELPEMAKTLIRIVVNFVCIHLHMTSEGLGEMFEGAFAGNEDPNQLERKFIHYKQTLCIFVFVQ